MRTPSLQYLYLQKPITMIVIVCILAVLPWIVLDNPAGRHLPPDAAFAETMLQSGDWILPHVQNGVATYDPPMANWLMVVTSLPAGHVTGLTSRLPSAIAFVLLSGFILLFFGRRVSRFQEAFVGTLFFITAYEVHRAAMTAQIDMLFTLFIMLALFLMYSWEDQMELKGLPVIIPLLLSCAVLTKGPVGLILPLIIFVVYLVVLRKYRARTIWKAFFYMLIPSLFLPMLWYVAAWKEGQSDFFGIVLAGHRGGFATAFEAEYSGFGYNILTILYGFVPWSVFFIFSLCGFKYRHFSKQVKMGMSSVWERVLRMSKVRLFALVSLVIIIVYYSIFKGGGAPSLIPAYPFISLFVAKYILYLTENRTLVTRVFATFYAFVVSVASVIIVFTMTGVITLTAFLGQFFTSDSSMKIFRDLDEILYQPRFLVVFLFAFILIALGAVIYQLIRRSNIKIMYATAALTLTIFLFGDGAVMHSLHNVDATIPPVVQVLNKPTEAITVATLPKEAWTAEAFS